MYGHVKGFVVGLLLGGGMVVDGATRAIAQDEPAASLTQRFLYLNPLRTKEFDSTIPLTLDAIGQRIDHVGESVRDDGLVVLKQPDVYSQARMTKYRRDFE